MRCDACGEALCHRPNNYTNNVLNTQIDAEISTFQLCHFKMKTNKQTLNVEEREKKKNNRID